jgi:hypothetical protein
VLVRLVRGIPDEAREEREAIARARKDSTGGASAVAAAAVAAAHSTGDLPMRPQLPVDGPCAQATGAIPPGDLTHPTEGGAACNSCMRGVCSSQL